LVGTQSKLKAENTSAFGINVPWFTDWQIGAELGVAHPLPSAPHLPIVLLYTE
jgi:hypothetical protein